MDDNFKSILSNLKDKYLRNKNLAKWALQLNYKKVSAMIDECNNWSLEACETEKKVHKLFFYIVPKSVKHLIWRSTVEIEFRKIDIHTERILKTRILKLKQFLLVYQQIMNIKNSCNPKRMEYSMICNRLDQNRTHFPQVSSSSVENVSMSECSICLNAVANVVLPCMHSYCSNCTKDWMDNLSIIRPELNPWEIVQIREPSVPVTESISSQSLEQPQSLLDDDELSTANMPIRQNQDDPFNEFGASNVVTDLITDPDLNQIIVQSVSRASYITCPNCRAECTSESEVWSLMEAPDDNDDFRKEMSQNLDGLIDKISKEKTRRN